MKLSLAGGTMALALAMPMSAGAQAPVHPFGLTLGASHAELRRLLPSLRVAAPADTLPSLQPPAKAYTAFLGYAYLTDSVPHPYPAFQRYVLVITPQRGLCRVVAISGAFEDDPAGTATMKAFAGLQTALTEKYGKPRVFDLLLGSSTLKAPAEWMAAVYKQERIVSAFWQGGSAAAPLGPGLTAIGLEVKAVSPSSGYLTLGYDAVFFDRCRAEAEQAASNGL